MRYAIARYKSSQKELAYRIYITDSVQLLAQGKSLQKRFYDFLCNGASIEEDKPAADVAHDILFKAGIEVKTEDGECI